MHLQELTGALNLNGFGNPMTGLKAGDFAGLTGITQVDLANNRLRDIPAGVFDPLTALTTLRLNNNSDYGGRRFDAPASGVFDRLTGLQTLLLLHAQRFLVVATADLREADESQPTGQLSLNQQPRQRALRAEREGRPRGRGRRRLGRERHP